MEIKQAFWILRHGSGEGLREYLKAIKTIEDNCVSVVRCKACKYYKPDEYECGCDFAGGLPYVKENAELVAEILDYDANGEVAPFVTGREE